jgi:hypothetical protein
MNFHGCVTLLCTLIRSLLILLLLAVLIFIAPAITTRHSNVGHLIIASTHAARAAIHILLLRCRLLPIAHLIEVVLLWSMPINRIGLLLLPLRLLIPARLILVVPLVLLLLLF